MQSVFCLLRITGGLGLYGHSHTDLVRAYPTREMLMAAIAFERNRIDQDTSHWYSIRQNPDGGFTYSGRDLSSAITWSWQEVEFRSV